MAPFVQAQPLAVRQINGADEQRIRAHVVRAELRVGVPLASQRLIRRARTERRIEQRNVKPERLAQRRNQAARYG